MNPLQWIYVQQNITEVTVQKLKHAQTCSDVIKDKYQKPRQGQVD